MASEAKRVLIVDDHSEGRDALRMVLEFTGYVVRDAGNGTQALDVALSWHPDAICLDLRLPDMSGYEVATKLCAAFGDKRPQLIAITGLTTDAHRERAAEVGFDGYILKPFEIDLLLELISSDRRRPVGEPLSRPIRRGAWQ